MSFVGNREELARICTSHIEAGITPGLALCYGRGSEESDSPAPLWSFGHLRYEQKQAVDADTHYDIASLTKSFIAALWARRWPEIGDRKIRDIIQGAPDGPLLSQLLGHAGGFPAHIEFFRKLRHHPEPRAELLRLVSGTPLAYEPGEKTLYSDLGYILLGFALEEVSGAPLQSLFENEIAAPLGLSGTLSYPDDDYRQSRTIAPTEVDEERGEICGQVHDENAFFGGGICGHAGLFSTAAGVARFAKAILRAWRGENRYFPSKVIRHFLSTAQAPGTSWRMGWDTPSAKAGVSHAGDRWPRANAVGHLGFTGCSMWLSLDHDAYAVLLSNRVHPTREKAGIRELRRDIMDWVAVSLSIAQTLD